MKKLYGLIVVLIIAGIAFLGYNFGYKVSPRDFISQDTIMIYALEEKMSEEENKELAEILKDMGTEYNYENIQKVSKYISKLYILSDGDFITGGVNTVGVIDTGLWYPFVVKESSKYFDRDGEFYKLKPEYTKEITEGIKDIALAEEKNLDIFAVFHRGQIIISENKEFLGKFIAKEKSYSSKIENILDSNKNNPYGVLVYNNMKYRDIGIEAAALTLSIGRETWDVKLKIYGTEEVFSIFKEQPTERKLLKYLNNNQVYLSMNDFSKAEDIIFNSYTLGNKEAVTMIWQGMFGMSPEDMLKDIDGEIIIDNINKSAIIPFKNSERASKIVEILDQFGGEAILKDGNTIIYGENTFTENKDPYVVEATQFLSADMDMYEALKFPEFQGVKGKIKGIGNEIDIDLFITYDRIKENWNKTKEEKGF